jgi:hypothetical protein
MLETEATRIPKKFSVVLAAVDAVCAEFQAREGFRPFDESHWIRDVSIINDDDVAHVAFMLEVEPALLSVYVALQMPDAKDCVNNLAQAVALANFGLRPGCFELDMDSGDIRYRCTLILSSLEISERNVAQLLADGLQMARTYASAFQKIVLLNVSPTAAISEVEK